MISPRLKQLFDFLKSAPNDPFTLYSIAYEFQQEGKFDQALEYFLRLKNTDPHYIGTYYHLGKTLERLKRKEEALQAYQEGINMAQKLKERHALSELLAAVNDAMEEG